MSDYDTTPVPAAIMDMSAEIGEIAKALPKAQAAMGDVFKNANNPAFRSKYADLAAGISLLQPVAYDGERVNVGTMLLHESGQWVRCTLSLPVSKRDAHGIGSAVTYGKRYGLQSMSGVAPEDDDGNGATAKDSAKKDYGPSSMADDFHGSDGQKGKSSYAAKKDGTDKRFNELRAEIAELESPAACGAWAAARAEEIKAMPESWRKELRGDLDTQRHLVAQPEEMEPA